jgi:hypothetical protein
MPAWLIELLGGPLVQKLLDLIPDPAERQRRQFELMKAAQDEAAKAAADQRDINQAEAANPSLFVAGWRPAVGWLCVTTLAYQWMLAPALSWLFVVTGQDLTPLPVLGKDDAQVLLYALLGLGGLRTLDKLGGNDTKGIAGLPASGK